MRPVNAALITQNCIAGQFDSNVNNCLKLIHQAVELGAEFIVFPEMNLTGYITGPAIKHISRSIQSDLTAMFSDLCYKKNITLLVGLAEKIKDNGEIYASHLIFPPDKSMGTYRKIHTAPFEKKYFTAGNHATVFQSRGLTFGVQLCYDAHFPELSLAMAGQNADIIFIPHASPRGTPKEKYKSWVRHLTARAFDNGIYIAACNQVGNNHENLNFPGISLFIGPDGNVISKSLSDKENIHIINIDRAFLEEFRSHKMRYFLPNRRTDLFKL